MTTTPARNAQTAALEALIEAHAIELKLPTVRRRFKALAAEALREQQTPVAYLGALLEAEMAERAERREKRRLIDARFPQIKRLEDFRFADNPKVPQATIAALAEGSWIDDRESVIFVGDSGTGKTMLATALAVCACHQGRRVRFTTLAGLANELQEAQSNRELERVIGRYARTELMVCDELGYLALPDGAAELVFQVLSERHERGSLIITTIWLRPCRDSSRREPLRRPRGRCSPPAAASAAIRGRAVRAAGEQAAGAGPLATSAGRPQSGVPSAPTSRCARSPRSAPM
jgi:DNA replication protein DnaC